MNDLLLALCLIIAAGALVGGLSTVTLALVFGEIVGRWSPISARLAAALSAPAILLALAARAQWVSTHSRNDMAWIGAVGFTVMAAVAAVVAWPLAYALIPRRVKPTRRP